MRKRIQKTGEPSASVTVGGETTTLKSDRKYPVDDNPINISMKGGFKISLGADTYSSCNFHVEVSAPLPKGCSIERHSNDVYEMMHGLVQEFGKKHVESTVGFLPSIGSESQDDTEQEHDLASDDLWLDDV